MSDKDTDKDTYVPERDSWKTLVLIALIVAFMCWLLY